MNREAPKDVPRVKRIAGTHGQGGYVIWPPSDGYEVVHEGEVARLPSWIVRRLMMAPRRPRRAEYVSVGQQRLEALANFVVHSRRGEPAARALWAASQAREVVEAGKVGEQEARATIARAAMAAGVDERDALLRIFNRAAAQFSPSRNSGPL